MNNVINNAAPPRVRRLMVEYKDQTGRDFNQELVTIHSPEATDVSLVDSIREALAGRGCTLTTLLEFLNDGSHRALYLGRGYLEEYMKEFGVDHAGRSSRRHERRRGAPGKLGGTGK